ncbi:MAG: hypothetical protein ABJB66_09505 [Gemmatimonadaceae bacterium]
MRRNSHNEVMCGPMEHMSGYVSAPSGGHSGAWPGYYHYNSDTNITDYYVCWNEWVEDAPPTGDPNDPNSTCSLFPTTPGCTQVPDGGQCSPGFNCNDPGNNGGGNNGGGGGEPPPAPPLSGPEAYADNTGLPELPFEDLGGGSFDCTKVHCHDPAKIVRDAAVQQKASELFAKSIANKREYGVWIFQNYDGSFRFSEILEGDSTSVQGMNSSLAPWNAVASLHTHWQRDVGPSGCWSAGPCDAGDAGNARQTHTYAVIASVSWFYVLDQQGEGLFKMHRN